MIYNYSSHSPNELLIKDVVEAEQQINHVLQPLS